MGGAPTSPACVPISRTAALKLESSSDTILNTITCCVPVDLSRGYSRAWGRQPVRRGGGCPRPVEDAVRVRQNSGGASPRSVPGHPALPCLCLSASLYEVAEPVLFWQRRAADIDQNHAVDVEDLLYVLKHYDEECPVQRRPAGGRTIWSQSNPQSNPRLTLMVRCRRILRLARASVRLYVCARTHGEREGRGRGGGAPTARALSATVTFTNILGWVSDLMRN